VVIFVSGVLKEIIKTKTRRPGSSLRDISDGAAYKEMLAHDADDDETLTLTALFNTDGVNLYSSTKTELWPLFFGSQRASTAEAFR
jgi:hypothetical protein